MAVPATRVGARAEIRSGNILSGSAVSASRAARIPRPVFHVVMIVKTAAATTSGNHPPCGIFDNPAVQKPRSMVRNTAARPTVAAIPHPQRARATTANRIVVNTMSVVTATPDAAARVLDDRNPTTSPTHAIARSQLSPGM